MVPGAPDEARWIRLTPRTSLPAALLERIVDSALPGRRVLAVEPFAGGFRNANFRLLLDSTPESVVLRIYEHDPSLCRKELDLIRLVARSVPVPEILHAEPGGWEELPPFTLARYVQGISPCELAQSGDVDAMAEAAFSAGEALAAAGRFTFSKAGWLGPGPAVTAPLLEGADPAPRFIDLCLASTNLQRHMPADLCDRVHALVWSWAPQLSDLVREPRLVHGDYNKRNLLVRCTAGRWSVAAVLDWEFAVSGSPLADVGNFLRYERSSRPRAEPHFSAGFVQAGGTLPPHWRQSARILDLIASCESLTHDRLAESLAAELVESVRATVEDRDPRLS